MIEIFHNNKCSVHRVHDSTIRTKTMDRARSARYRAGKDMIEIFAIINVACAMRTIQLT